MYYVYVLLDDGTIVESARSVSEFDMFRIYGVFMRKYVFPDPSPGLDFRNAHHKVVMYHNSDIVKHSCPIKYIPDIDIDTIL